MEYKDILQNKVANAVIKSKIKKMHIDQIEQNSTNYKKLDTFFGPVTKMLTDVKDGVDKNFKESVGNLKSLLEAQKPKETSSVETNSEEPNLDRQVVTWQEESSPKKSKIKQLDTLPSNYDKLGKIAKTFLKKKDDKQWGVTPHLNYSTGQVDYYFGNYPVEFIEGSNDFIYKDKQYEGTPGLWELLTMKLPEYYIMPGNKRAFVNINENKNKGKIDKDTYLEMIKDGDVHLTTDNRLRSSKGYKFTEFISPWYVEDQKVQFHVKTPKRERSDKDVSMRKPKSRTSSTDSKHGAGVIEFLSSDPHELIKELHILLLNHQVGHTNVDFNKVSRIAEELYRLKKISKKHCTRLLLKKFGK